MTTNSTADVHATNARALAALSEDDVMAHFGEYAIFYAGELISYHKSNKDAIKTACAKYKVGQFSVQRIEPQPIELGLATCANYPR